MNNFKAKNIILNLSGTSDLPYSTPNDIILKDNQSVNYGFNNSVQQLADNDIYIRHVLREQAEYQPGPEWMTDDSLAKTIDNYKYLNIDGNDISILQKKEDPLSDTLKQVNSKNAKTVFRDGRYFMLADDGLYAATQMEELKNGKLFNLANSQICATVYNEDRHILLFGGLNTGLIGKVGVAYGFDTEQIRFQLLDMKLATGAKIQENVMSLDYDGMTNTLYIGTSASTTSGSLYVAKNIELSPNNSSINVDKTQPITSQVLAVCKLSGNDKGKILAGTYGDGMYESTDQYTFADLKDIYTFPSSITTTCFGTAGDTKLIGTTAGLYIFNGATPTAILTEARINKIRTFDRVCYVATSNGLYTLNGTTATKILDGSITDMCYKNNGMFAVAKNKGVVIAKNIASPVFEEITALKNEVILSIAKLDNYFYMSTASKIYKVDVQYIETTVTDKNLVSWKNSVGKTFSQAVPSATIVKAVEINNKLYILTTKGLYDTEFNKQYGISSKVNAIYKYTEYLFVCTSTGLYIIYGSSQVQQYAQDEVYAVTVDGSMLYAAIKSGNNSILVAEAFDTAASVVKQHASQVKLVSGSAFTIAGVVDSLELVDNRVFIVSNNKFLYIDTIETLDGLTTAAVLTLSANQSSTKFNFATDENFRYCDGIDDSQYVSLAINNNGTVENALYKLGTDNRYSRVNTPSAYFPPMTYNPTAACGVKNIAAIGSNSKTTVFTNTANAKVLYNFEQSNIALSDVNISSAAELNSNDNVSKMTYPNNINSIVDVTSRDDYVKYGVSNRAGQALLVGTEAGLYLHNKIVRNKQLSTLNDTGRTEKPPATLTCMAVAQYDAYQQVEDGITSNGKELIYLAANGSVLSSASTVGTRTKDKNNKYEYADLKKLYSFSSSEHVNKIRFMYVGANPAGAYICTNKKLYFASIEFRQTTVDGLALFYPEITVQDLNATCDDAALTNITDCEIIYGRLYIISDGSLYYGELAAGDQHIVFHKFVNTAVNANLSKMAITESGYTGNVVGLCIQNNNTLVSFEHGASKLMAVVNPAVSGTSGTFKQPVVLANAANQIVLAAVATISSRQYIVYITQHNDEWHKMKLDDGSDAAYQNFTLNMFNVYDAQNGRAVGCIIQQKQTLYNINILNKPDFSQYADNDEELALDEIAEEQLPIAASVNLQNEWFAASGDDLNTIQDGVESIPHYVLVTALNNKPVIYYSTFKTELNATQVEDYKIENIKVRFLAKSTLRTTSGLEATVIARCGGEKAAFLMYENYPATVFEITEAGKSIDFACIDQNSHLFIYVVSSGGTQQLKFVKFDVEELTAYNTIAVRQNGDPIQIPIGSIGTITGMFNTNGNTYIVANAIYEVKHFIAALAAPANVDSFLNDSMPISIRTENNKLILHTSKNGQFQHFQDLIFNRIDDRADSFAIIVNNITYAIKNGQIWTRTYTTNEYGTNYNYQHLDTVYDSVVAKACFRKGTTVCLIATNDVKYIQTSSHVDKRTQQIANARFNSTGATELLETGNQILAYGKGSTILFSESEMTTISLGIDPTLVKMMYTGFLAYDKTDQKIVFTYGLADGEVYKVESNDEIRNSLVDAAAGSLVTEHKLLEFSTIGQDMFFKQVDGTDRQVVRHICRVNDDEALFSMYVEKSKECLYWMKHNMKIKNQLNRNAGIAKIVSLNSADTQTASPMFAILREDGKIYVSTNEKFTSWRLLLDMKPKNAALNSITMFTPYCFAICTSKGLFTTAYSYKLKNNFSKTTQYDVNAAIAAYCLSCLSSHITSMHTNNTDAGKFINTVNTELMPNDFSEISPTWQKIDNDCMVIENDVVEKVEFGATDMHISAMYANASDLSTWTNSTDMTYIDKQYKSNVHELYIHLPTTGTNYVPLPIFSDSENAVSGIVQQNATHIRVLLDPLHYDMQEMMEVQINANSFPLGMTKTEDKYGDEGKMFHSCILPSIAKFAPLANNVGAESIPKLSGMYMFEFICFGSDEQAIKMTFKAKNKYSVQFKAETEAYGYMEDQMFTVGETQNLAKNKYIKDGCLFNNWKYKDFNNINHTYADQAQIKSTFDNTNQSFTNNNGVKIQLSATFTSAYPFDNNDTIIQMNSSLAYISNAQTFQYKDTNKFENTGGLNGVVVNFGE